MTVDSKTSKTRSNVARALCNPKFSLVSWYKPCCGVCPVFPRSVFVLSDLLIGAIHIKCKECPCIPKKVNAFIHLWYTI